MPKPRLLASSATLEGITKLTREWYVDPTISLVPLDAPNRWEIQKRGQALKAYVEKVKSRYRLVCPT